MRGLVIRHIYGAILGASLLALPARAPAAGVSCVKMPMGIELGCQAGETCSMPPNAPPMACKCIARGGTVSPCRPLELPKEASDAARSVEEFVPPGMSQGIPNLNTGAGKLPPGPRRPPQGAPKPPPGVQDLEPRISPAQQALDESDAAFQREDYTAAIAGMRRAAAMDQGLRGIVSEKMAEAFYRRGLQYAAKERDGEAASDFKTALDLDRSHAGAKKALEEMNQKNSSGPQGQIDLSFIQGQNATPGKLSAKVDSAPDIGAYPMGPGERVQETGTSSKKSGLVLILAGIAAVLAVIAALMFRRANAPADAESPEADAAAGPAAGEPAAGPDEFGGRIRELMDSGQYDKAMTVFASRNSADITEADRVNLFEIHLRRGNVDGARMVFESVKGSGLLAGNPGLSRTLAGLCAGLGLVDIAAELTRTRASGGTTSPSTGGNVAAEQLDDSPLYARAVSLVKDGKNDAALAAVLEKPKAALTLNDHCLLFEIYLRRKDFDRAGLMLAQMDKQVAAAHPVKRLQGRLFFAPALSAAGRRTYSFCAAMARFCREKKRPDFARKLCRMAVDCAVTSSPVREKPQGCYELALALEADGDRVGALELFTALSENTPPYKDSMERRRRLDALVTSAPAVKPGTQTQALGAVLAGRYELKGELGSGGMGVVYEGADRQGGSKVAVKKMHSSLKSFPREYERFVGEAKVVEKLKHPNIVGVRGIVEQDGETYLIFDFVDGRTLQDLLREKQQLPLDVCKVIFKGVCEAVHFAHTHNIIHRDIKPANIMLTGDNTVKVMDFGLASELRESMTRLTHQTTSGTPAYMAPEQHEGLVKRESDIYAIGVCLYEMLAGKLPFDGEDYEGMKRAQGYKAISAMLPWLPSGVDGVIDRALAPDPSQRFADAMELYSALKDL